jgi:hypothetical protein
VTGTSQRALLPFGPCCCHHVPALFPVPCSLFLFPVSRFLPHMDVPMPRRQDAESGRFPFPAAHGCANAAKAGCRERPFPLASPRQVK